jgi:lipopolysaccharide export LptBFGC system permease protein LptF
MRLMDWHIACRLGLYAIGIQLALSQMVVLLNTLVILRPILGGALPSSVFWDAYLGAMPNVFYLVLPLSAAFALALGYIHYARDRMFVVLFGACHSHWRLAAPGLAVAAGMAIAGALVANVLAPLGANRLEDAKHLIRAELPHRLLPERQFVDLVPSRLTMFFKEWREPDVVSQISLYDRRDEAEHRVIDAQAARFVRDGRSLSIVLGAGTLHTFDVASGRARKSSSVTSPSRTRSISTRSSRAGHGLFSTFRARHGSPGRRPRSAPTLHGTGARRRNCTNGSPRRFSRSATR